MDRERIRRLPAWWIADAQASPPASPAPASRLWARLPTSDKPGLQRCCVYDAWNRLTKVLDDQDALLIEYVYDALGRRITEDPLGVQNLRDLFYSRNWQVLEEWSDGLVAASYVWSPVYIDCMVTRDRNMDGDGELEERVYPMHDANYNVTALANNFGVQERYVYDPFGKRTIIDASWNTQGASSYAWIVGYQGLRLEVISGLNDARGRWVSPTLGRPISVDPIGLAGGYTNRYVWEGNNPFMFLDPFGLQPATSGTSQWTTVSYHHWFPRKLGQGPINRLCSCPPTFSIDDFTTPLYDAESSRGSPHWFLTHGGGDPTQKWEVLVAQVYKDAKDCCDLLKRMLSLIIGAYLDLSVTFAAPPGPDSTLEFYDYNQKQNNTTLKYAQLLMAHCKKDDRDYQHVLKLLNDRRTWAAAAVSAAAAVTVVALAPKPPPTTGAGLPQNAPLLVRIGYAIGIAVSRRLIGLASIDLTEPLRVDPNNPGMT